MKKKSASTNIQHLTPCLLYKDVGKAITWLRKAFQFLEFGDRFEADDGTVQHAAMKISPDGEIFMMGCPGPKYKNPKKLGAATQLLYISVKDVDGHYRRAKRAGAKVLQKPEDTFYGDRRYAISDPEGHQWFFAEHIRNVTPEEMKKAMKG